MQHKLTWYLFYRVQFILYEIQRSYDQARYGPRVVRHYLWEHKDDIRAFLSKDS